MEIPTKQFIKDNISGRARKEFLQKEYPDFLDFLYKNYPNDLSINEMLYWYFNDLKEHPKCKTCGSENVSYQGFNKGYKYFCSLKCSRNCPDTIEKLKKTNLERYGYEFNSQSPTVKEKLKKTNLERYGHVCPLHNKEIQNKSRKTKLERYGDETYTNPNKMKETNLERYGVSCTMKLDLIKSKSRKTKLERYGNETYTNRDKAKFINNIKYGGDSPFHSKQIQKLSHQTKINNFQIKNPWLKSFNYDDQQRLVYICNCPHPECNKCESKEYEILAQQYGVRRYNNIETCTHLLPIQLDKIQGTYIEIFIRNILDEYNIEYQMNVRNIISPKEIDIYIPSHNLAIECNGIYWHSQKDKNYHIQKYKLCNEKNIQLLTFWEDWIKNKPEIIKSILLSKLGIYNERIYARKCIVKNISNNDVKNFVNEHHLQGYVNSSIKLGLYYGDELVSVMTFGKKRRIMNNNSKEDEYEIYRFCNKANIQIIGGASKLFNYFIKHYNPEIIESYSSNDISNGKLYEILGFKKISENISEWYIDQNFNRYHRFKFARKTIPDNIIKFFDSGNTKYIWHRSEVWES